MSLRRGIEAVGITIALGFGVACGGDGDAEAPQAGVTGTDLDVAWDENRRILTSPGHGRFRLEQLCDGTEFVELSRTSFGFDSDRYAGHVACADSVLTVEDFPVDP
jgi:hypothetical protein